MPHEARLNDAAELHAVLAAAGLRDVNITQREYRIAMSLDDYLKMCEVFTYGRFLRATLGSVGWHEFRSEAEKIVRGSCPKGVEYTGRYHIAVGEKPGHAWPA